jgi:hypothetical protein
MHLISGHCRRRHAVQIPCYRAVAQPVTHGLTRVTLADEAADRLTALTGDRPPGGWAAMRSRLMQVPTHRNINQHDLEYFE